MMTTMKCGAALGVKSSKLDVTTHTDISLSDPGNKDEEFTVTKMASPDVTFESLLQEATVAERPIYYKKVSNDEKTKSEEVAHPPLHRPFEGSIDNISASDAADAEGSKNGSLASIFPFKMEDLEVNSASFSRTGLEAISTLLEK